MWNIFVPFKVEGWNYHSQNGAKVTIEASTEASASGEYSLKLTNPDGYTHNVFTWLTQVVEVEPNTTYTYGMKAKAKGLAHNSAWFSVRGREMTGRQTISDSDDWKEYTFEYTTGANETTLDFTALFENMIDYLYIDDCFIKKQGTKENILTNGNFDSYSEASKFDKEAMEMGIYIDY